MAKCAVTKDTVVEGCIENLVKLTSNVLARSKKSKIIPNDIKKQIIEINHCAAMALMRIKSDS